MPKIPVFTAQGNGVQLRLPSANANALGGQAGSATIGFGQVLSQIDAALQDQRDKLDLSSLDADYRLGLDAAYQKSLEEPDIAKQPMAFAKQVDALHGDLMKRPLSNTVRTAFQIHRNQLDAQAVIALQHEGRALETERQIVRTTQDAEQRMDQAARYSLVGWEAKNGDVANLNGMATALVNGLEQNRHLSPMKAQAVKESLQDRYWSEFARQHPDEMQSMRAGGPMAGRNVPMDWGKLTHYEQIAAHELNQRAHLANAQHKQQGEAAKKQFLTGMYGDGTRPGQDMLREISANEPFMDSTEYEHFLGENAKVNVARATITHTSQLTTSRFEQEHLLDQALRAKYDETINLDTLEHDVRTQVWKARTLHPDHAGEVLRAIGDARGHRLTTDTPKRRAQTDALRSLDILVPMRSEPEEAHTLRTMEDTMKRQFTALMDANPAWTPLEMRTAADEIRAHGETRILGAQQLTMQRIDEVLIGMEANWSALMPGIASSSHTLDTAKRTVLEQQYPLMRGLFALHDKRRERWEQLTKIGQDLAAQAAKGKKK